MKSLAKMAICGMLAIAASGAYAASVQLVENAAAAAQRNAIARKILNDVESKLGLATTASVTDINAAMAKITGTQELANVVNALNAFSNATSKQKVDPSSSTGNSLAQTIFKSANGQLMVVGNIVDQSATRSTPSAPVASAPANSCDPGDVAAKLSAGTNRSYADALAAERDLNIDAATCGTDLTTISADARGNAIEIAKEEDSCLGGASPVGNPQRTTCLTKAFGNVLDEDATTAGQSVADVDSGCGYFRK